MPVIAEGKTKRILPTNEKDIVQIQSKPDITSGDGEQRDIIVGKEVSATTTTANIFRLLKFFRIPTHYIGHPAPDTFLARRCIMIPIECIARRIATGSYLKRNLDVVEGQIFPDLVTELFFKDDKRHDPMMKWNDSHGNWDLFSANDSNSTPIDTINIEVGKQPIDDLVAMYLESITRDVFIIIEQAWKDLGVALVDFKIEFGFDQETGELLVADVIDNDSWRIWPAGDKAQDKSKQVYRDSKNRTHAELGAIKKNYAWVAEQTNRMING